MNVYQNNSGDLNAELAAKLGRSEALRQEAAEYDEANHKARNELFIQMAQINEFKNVLYVYEMHA